MYEDVVRSLRKIIKAHKEIYGGSTEESVAIEQAAYAIEELSMKLHGDEAAIAGMKREIERMVVAGKPRWIPVTERLPENSERVLIHSGDYVGCGLYTGEFWKDEYHDYVIVTHWMPLPEPPKEET